MANWLDRPVLGPMSVRQVGKGLREAVIDPLARDEQALYEARHANPTVDLAASQLPHYGIPAAIQDIAHGGDPVMEGAGAIPFVKGLRGAWGMAKEIAAQGGRKAQRASGVVMGGAVGIAGANSAARGQEIMNPGVAPSQYK